MKKIMVLLIFMIAIVLTVFLIVSNENKEYETLSSWNSKKKLENTLPAILIINFVILVLTLKIKYNYSTNKKMEIIILCLLGGVELFLNFIAGIIIIIILANELFLPESRNLVDKKDRKKIKEAEYYRNIPCENDLYKAYYIAMTCGLVKNANDFLGAIFLKWLKEGKISIVKRDIEILGKEEECIQFNLVYSDEEKKILYKKVSNEIEKEESVENFNKVLNAYRLNQAFLNYENKLFDYIMRASQDGILEKKELKKWCEKHYLLILDWFKDVLINEENKLIKSGDIEKNINGKEKIIYGSNVLNEAIKLSGLKKYLKSYTLIHDKEAIEVELLEEYLIYAQMFGISKKVMKEFKSLYPNIIVQSSFESLNNINILLNCRLPSKECNIIF